MNRLRGLFERCDAEPSVLNRRGPAKQRRRCEREQRLREHIVDFTRWTRAEGWRAGALAELLELAPRTLRKWHYDLERGRLRLSPLGRPVLRSAPAQRNEVIGVLDEFGPRLDLPLLLTHFPHMARAELADLVRRYRRVWRQRHRQALYVLHWQVVGTVWAIDFAEAPAPIDGIYPYLLAVRDLASGQQLLWRPLREATATEAIVALAPLFLVDGAPLVLKSDNGSPFCAAEFLDFLASWQVLSLFSPTYTPQYNGAIEAGIGSSKSRTEEHASRAGHPGYWTWPDTEASRVEANATAHPKGPNGPSSDELWNARRPTPPAIRARFGAAVEAARNEARRQGG
jgi:transposase InsO family protein